MCYLSKLIISLCLSFHLLNFLTLFNALQSLGSTYLWLNLAESQLTEHPEKHILQVMAHCVTEDR